MIFDFIFLIVVIVVLAGIVLWFRFLLKNKVPQKLIRILDKYSKS